MMNKKKVTELEQIVNTDIVLPDIHVPFEDMGVINPVLKYIKDVKPKRIIQLGDMYDCYALSRFDKDPKRIDSLQEEIDRGTQIWEMIKHASPGSELIMLEGNHERRLRKYLLKNPGMYSLKALQPKNLFELEKLGITFYPAEKTFFLNKSLIVTHGATDDGGKLSQKSAYSARANLEKFGISGISGHTHRIGSTSKTLPDYMLQWCEIGCLTNLKPEYVKFPDWQHGFATVHYTQKRFHITPTTIVNGEFYADKKIYR